MELKKPNLFFIRSDKLTVFYGGSWIILGHVWSPKPQFVGRDYSVRPQKLDRLFCALDPQFTLTFQFKSSGKVSLKVAFSEGASAISSSTFFSSEGSDSKGLVWCSWSLFHLLYLLERGVSQGLEELVSLPEVSRSSVV